MLEKSKHFLKATTHPKTNYHHTLKRKLFGKHLTNFDFGVGVGAGSIFVDVLPKNVDVVQTLCFDVPVGTFSEDGSFGDHFQLRRHGEMLWRNRDEVFIRKMDCFINLWDITQIRGVDTGCSISERCCVLQDIRSLIAFIIICDKRSGKVRFIAFWKNIECIEIHSMNLEPNLLLKVNWVKEQIIITHFVSNFGSY